MHPSFARQGARPDPVAVEEAAARVEEQWGRIDVWLNVAVATACAVGKGATSKTFRRVTEVAYLGYVHGTLSALRRMLPNDRGTIVQVGSARMYPSVPLQSACAAAKVAIRSFTDSLRSELRHDGSHVRLTHVHLPSVDTPRSAPRPATMRQRPVVPSFAPEIIARGILWAAYHAPGDVNPGTSSVEDPWERRLLSALVDAYLVHRECV
jgi:NAD(P)-dependent dehydrogenase (short-subunit alcohol dehydrogenase family)